LYTYLLNRHIILFHTQSLQPRLRTHSSTKRHHPLLLPIRSMAMKRPRIPLSSNLAKISTVVMLLLSILTVSVLAITYQTYQAASSASASGPFAIIWGDPYLPANVGQGTGWESFTVNGNVAKWANVSGYYVYTSFIVQGRMHGKWSSEGNAYVLDANLSLAKYEN